VRRRGPPAGSRDFALERCAQHDDLDRLRSRHFDHFLAFATRADEELRGLEQAEWLVRPQVAEDNLRAAVRWGLSAGDPTSALDLVWLLHQYWWWVGNFLGDPQVVRGGDGEGGRRTTVGEPCPRPHALG
jgi:predicted ATPase